MRAADPSSFERYRSPVSRARTVTTSDGLRLKVYVTAGPSADAPTVVLVHGYPDDHTVWDGVVGELKQHARVVTYDVRGAGQSDVPAKVADYRLDQLSSDLLAVIDSVSPGVPVHLVAHDWGSIQAWETVTDPEARDRLISYTSISGPCLDHVARWMRNPLNARASLGQLLHSYYIGVFQLPKVPELLARAGVIDSLANLSFRKGLPLRIDFARRPEQNVTNGVNLYRANFVDTLISPEPRSTTVPVQVLAPLDDPHVTVALATQAPKPFVTDLHTRTVIGNHWVVQHRPEMISGKVLEFMKYAEGGELPATLHHPTGEGEYADQRVLVTGADTAVGRVAALAFAREGARVGLVGTHEAALAETASLVGDHGTVLGGDHDTDLISHVTQEWGVPDVVINNAGRTLARGFAELIASYAEGGTIINVAQPPHTVLERSTKRLRTDFARDGVRVAVVAADTQPAVNVVEEILTLVSGLRP